METPPDRARITPVYELGEAAQLTGVDPRKIASWFGSGSPGGAPPLLGDGGENGNGRQISFLDLVELDLAGMLMRNGLSEDRIREIRAYADARLDARYPFARVEMGTICRHADGGERDAAHDGAPPPLTPELAREIEANARSRFGYTDAWAGFFFPLGRGALLNCDPLVRGGRLTLRDRSLTAELIAEMLDGGQTVAQIVWDYDLAPAEVEAVIEFYADR